MRRVDSLEKTDAGRDWGQEEKGMTEDEMAGWHHWLDGHESEWTLGVSDGQGGLACCDSRDPKESDTTERLNWTVVSVLLQCFNFKPASLSKGEQLTDLMSLLANDLSLGLSLCNINLGKCCPCGEIHQASLEESWNVVTSHHVTLIWGGNFRGAKIMSADFVSGLWEALFNC